MHSHNDELNRYLDSLVLGTSGGSFDLDRETIEASSRFLNAKQPMSAQSAFVSRLEDSLLKRASMRPVAVTGRIEHIGEGIGLVAAKPLPRRIRIERIAALAAVVLLMLAAAGFYRPDSDNGRNWLLAPVASASPATSAEHCPNAEERQATEEANGMPTFLGIQVPVILGESDPQQSGVFAQTDVHMQPAPNDPAMLIQATALSDIPENGSPSPEVQDELAGQIPTDLYCVVSRDEALLTSPIKITRMTNLPEGRVGVLLDSDPLGYGAQFYMIYVQGTQQWLVDFMSFALPDSEFVAPSDLEIQKIVLLQGWNEDSNEVHSANGWPSPVGVQADTEVIFDVKNLGSEPLTFTITGTDVNVVLAVEEQRDIMVNLSPGVYRYSFSRPSDTQSMEPGFIFVTDVQATPVAATPTP